MNIAVIGASGAIGSAFINVILTKYPKSQLYAFSRAALSFEHPCVHSDFIDLKDENSIEKAAQLATSQAPLDWVIVTTGILHSDYFQPEKSLKELNVTAFQAAFAINTIGPALIAKHFLPGLNRKNRSIFAVLSARVGSISDNRKGGWYSYRASKAALNMLLKTASIETQRINPNAIVVGLHPGTVDSKLSQPFQKFIPTQKIFSPEYAATQLLNVLENLSPQDSGAIWAWDGQIIPA